MNRNTVQAIILFIVLCLVQVLVCNNISILGIATPFIFIYSIIRLPIKLHRNWTMTIGFFAGLTVDIFSNTQGMNALACTLLAVAREPALKLYLEHNDAISGIIPTPQSLGSAAYIKYLLTLTLLYCLTITFIEAFTLHNILVSLCRVIGSGLLTFVILLGIDALVNAGNEKGL